MSRQLDATVAESIMGKRYWLETRGGYSLAVGQLSDGRGPWMASRNGESEKHRYVPCSAHEAIVAGFHGDERLNLPLYSGDIAKAWPVVEKIIERAKDTVRFSIIGGDLSFGRAWGAEFFVVDTGERIGTATHCSEAKAICLAAVAANEWLAKKGTQ